MAPIPAKKPVKFLTNKDLLAEIHKSKSSYCEYIDSKYKDYDFIVHSLDDITEERITQARQKKLDDIISKRKKELILQGIKNPKIEMCLSDVPVNSIVIRLMTFDHIPINVDKIGKAKTDSEAHIRCNFPPFQHFIMENGQFMCVGKSHHKDGEFNLTHGKMTHRLALMYIEMVEKYGHRGNWRGYCVDTETEALTQRGWMNIDSITENDIIMSCKDGVMTWSNIKSIYRGEFDGLMHKLTVRGVDALITPGHKMLTINRGLVPAELLLESDHLLLMGEAENNDKEIYCNEFVELIGWIVTDGCYDSNSDGFLRRICIYQNQGPKSDRIRSCLTALNFNYTESCRDDKTSCFAIRREDSLKVSSIFPTKNLTMDFITRLTKYQRELLINTMIDGDGWRVGKHRRYVQKDIEHIDLFQALCVISGHRTNTHLRSHMSFGKTVTYHDITIFSPRKNITRVESMNFHGGKRNGRNTMLGKGKINHPNEPTTYYTGMVWCPETEYGCFLARRNGTVYITGNTYLDEMKSQALLQLSNVGLQFDESKQAIPNPFSYYTACLSTSFLRVLSLEKKNQNIRDDLLIMHGAMPSYTRQTEHEIEQRAATDKAEIDRKTTNE